MDPSGIEAVNVSDPDVDTENAASEGKEDNAEAKALELAGLAGVPAAIVHVGRGHSTAKAAVEAGVDREEIVKVAMEDGDVMAWLLATIPEYAKEKGGVRGSSPLSRHSLASLACVRLSLPLTPRVCHTHAIRVCVLPCAAWEAAAPQCRFEQQVRGGDKGAARRLPGRGQGGG